MKFLTLKSLRRSTQFLRTLWFHSTKEKMDALNVRLYRPDVSLPELKQRTSESMCQANTQKRRRSLALFLGSTSDVVANSEMLRTFMYIWSVHKKTRIPCPYLGIDGCDSTFARGDWVSIHIKTVHKQKRYLCPVAEKEECDATFTGL